MKSKKSWFHATTPDSTRIFFQVDNDVPPDSTSESIFGPFKSIAATKKDAIAYHRATISNAQLAINIIKTFSEDDVEDSCISF